MLEKERKTFAGHRACHSSMCPLGSQPKASNSLTGKALVQRRGVCCTHSSQGESTCVEMVCVVLTAAKHNNFDRR